MFLKILIVDDDAEALDLMQLLLQRAGHETHTAHGGESGLKSARSEEPDLILLDIHMPDPDGYQVLKTLRESPATASIPVILFGGEAQVGERIRALQAGAEAYLKKPFRPQDLFRKIEAVAGTDP